MKSKRLHRPNFMFRWCRHVMEQSTQRRKWIFFLLLVVTLAIYITLAWLDILPSVAHIDSVHVLWDKEFASCFHHKERQLLLPHTNRSELFISVSFSGRLGNWMYAYASIYGIARKNNRTLYTNSLNPLSRVFDIYIPSFGVTCSEPIKESKPCAYDPKMMDLPLHNVTIRGYLQSWKYFQDMALEIRTKFQFNPFIKSQAEIVFDRHVSKFGEKVDLLTCIHVRRTDMGIKTSTKLGFKMAPLEYILNAKEEMRRRHENQSIGFVVVSDDYEWCSWNLDFPDTVLIPRNMDPAVDLAILTMCNHSIITTGTFGWWGAYLANGDTIYYDGYPEPGTQLDRGTVKAEYFPESWIPVNAGNKIGTEHLIILCCLYLSAYIVKLHVDLTLIFFVISDILS